MMLIHHVFIIFTHDGGIILHVVPKIPTTSGGFMKVKLQNHRIIILYKEAGEWVRVTDKWILDKMYMVLRQLIRHQNDGKK